eukprot:10163716-Heterocapsa_arctica.AAC.1
MCEPTRLATAAVPSKVVSARLTAHVLGPGVAGVGPRDASCNLRGQGCHGRSQRAHHELEERCPR